MRYRRVEKAGGIRLFKEIIFLEIPLDFLHNSLSKHAQLKKIRFFNSLIVGLAPTARNEQIVKPAISLP
jgi:hypothetical protein